MSVKTYGPLPSELAADRFTAYLRTLFARDQFARRNAPDGKIFFDVFCRLPFRMNAEIKNVVMMLTAPPAPPGPETYRGETRINVYDSSYPEGQRFASQRNRRRSTDIFSADFFGWKP